MSNKNYKSILVAAFLIAIWNGSAWLITKTNYTSNIQEVVERDTKLSEAQAADLVSHFDWAMTEDCFADEWCEEMAPFTDAGKAVFAAEYTDQLTTNQFLDQVCPQAETWNLDVILKHRDLDAWRLACP